MLMNRASLSFRILTVLAAALMLGAADPGKVAGTFLMGKTDAKLAHVRATRVVLDDKGKSGYAILLSARPAEGDISAWRTGEPSERGSFIYLMLEKNGAVWVAELGHSAAKAGRFGVLSEVSVDGLRVEGNRLSGRLKTAGEQEFSDDRYSIDLTFDVPIEGGQ
jgi:hypothetical protein